jgi:hypothetical protein
MARSTTSCLRLGVRGLQLRGVLLAFALGVGPRGLRLLEGLADGLGALLHLGEQRLVEQLAQDEKEQEEIDGLDDDGPVQVDEAASTLGGQRHRRQHAEQKRSDGEYANHGEFSG